jgi:hypothetical protein
MDHSCNFTRLLGGGGEMLLKSITGGVGTLFTTLVGTL